MSKICPRCKHLMAHDPYFGCYNCRQCGYSEKDKYNLCFIDMMNEIFVTNGWYQGEDFKDGVFIKTDDSGLVHVYQFSEDKFGEIDCGLLSISSRTLSQRYRRVYTQPDIMRKISLW